MPAKKKSMRQTGPNSYDKFVAVLEVLQSDFKAFGEKQDLLQEQMNERFDRLEEKIENLDRRVTRLELRMSKLEEDMKYVKIELRHMRKKIDSELDLVDIVSLDQRVTALEQRVQA